jgi:hypothetical protein
MKRYIVFIIVLISCASCVSNSEIKNHVNTKETVLKAGMTLCATSDDEKICIFAEDDFKRLIYWDGLSNSITLVPRKERWHGKLGLVSPEPPKDLWTTKNGVTRALIQEAQINVKSVENISRGLNFPGRDDGYNVVYNDDGLLIIWKKSVLPDHNVLDLMLFQIISNGEKPKTLPGSQNDKIVVVDNGDEKLTK